MAIRDILDEHYTAPALLRLPIDAQYTNWGGSPRAQSVRARMAVARAQRARALAICRNATAALRRASTIQRRVQSMRPAGQEPGVRAQPTRPPTPLAASVETATHPRLTPREREVVERIARGMSNRAIARELVIQQGTVANHVAHILAKCGVANRTQLAALFLSSHTESP
jgi:DNA-binding NarL/FixJ family response regulator